MEALILNGSNLTLDALHQVVYDRRPVDIDPEAMDRAKRARQILFDMAAEGKPVYGLNRGVGWNKDREFDQDFFETFNRNLINSHSLGVRPFSTVEEVRAMMCIRLNCALCGCTGISGEILELYKEFLNRGIHPRAFRRGAVGEGDVSTLSLIGQTMIGQGEVEYKGEIIPAAQALEAEGMKPAILGPKDGLSIVSSNAQGESVVALLIFEVQKLLREANAVFALSLEGLNGGLQPLGEKVNALRGLPGQIKVAAQCREYLEGSYLAQPDPNRALQDPLSFRCTSAVHGTVQDALDYVCKFMEIQMNATDDNPCIILEDHTTSVSQNFETATLALAVEMLGIALGHMSKCICQRTTHLANPGFTGLNRFLTPVDVKTIAYSTIQKTFTCLDAENRLLANPCSMDFLPMSGDIEDHASNLPLAAAKALKMVDNLHYMLGIELMHGAQAVDLRGKPTLGKVSGPVYEALRAEIPYLSEDRNLSIDIENAYRFIHDGRLDKVISEAL